MAVTDTAPESQDSLAAEYIKQNPSANPSTAAATAIDQSAVPESQADLATAFAKQSQPQISGEIKNDIGNTVIVPKEGESFADTMKRAAAQGKKTTPEQIQAEVDTMPGKAATVIAAAPAIGAAGVSIPLLPEAVGAAKTAILKHLADQSPELFGHEAVKATLKRYALQGLQKSLAGTVYGAGIGVGAEILHSAWDAVFGKGK